MIENNRKY